MADFSPNKRGGRVGILGFLHRVVVATMGCFFGCFGAKDCQYHLVSTPEEGMVSNKNALPSVFLSDGSEKDSDMEKGESRNPREVVEFRELRNELDRSTSSSEDSSQLPKNSESSSSSSGSKQSPYPTPLKLSDDMQTPDSVYPAYMNNIAGGKTTRIQYVYPMSAMSKDDASVRNYRKEEGKIEGLSLTFAEEVEYGISPGPGDRPILGIVAAHWNDEEGTHSSPKWDGTGIPNTTTKYKEDQKVRWHATPFEERLEKALREDTLISQRRRLRGTPPIVFDEIEECDAASSQVDY